MTKMLGAVGLVSSLAVFASGAYGEARCDATDLNGDGVTNEGDFEILMASFGSNERLEGFDPAADPNGDGSIDFTDLAILQDCL